MTENRASVSDVLRFSDIDSQDLNELLASYHIELRLSPNDRPVPGSFWGGEEAGLLGTHLYLRADTPIHSILHEACHYICMDSERRQSLDTNAGSDDDEENAVCYLQVLLSGKLRIMGQSRMFRDMDRWGYSFRLGSAKAWFEQDAKDAQIWLRQHALIGLGNQPESRLR